ncbi:uncharacterized protein MYCFIDRAFT_163421 [Pseudocercospora fijiensis CIRAD86]|uniref:COP9 signalosome complex subunit 6 n=1 Tax=Pseudocercospora fijiensis (strain CIRAD86) TaxID=383855 RepID=M3A0B2_PSEFD|nr:uncharacterized protein MYCFIDRAFT_163421 [Pseudocercospora fijiensis CIRAD86]EME84604.1 hypothetical protein MYCFIDRAFT_163421 [Pseudocercospora fijiensis CIRAD86]
MAGKAAGANPLVIAGRPDTSLNVQLHPLVLLTISDYITRHTIRQQQGPALGAVIGQQNGRNFTLEHAYECKLADEKTSSVSLDGEWFNERLEMYKEVHKEPALDLVAVFALGPVDGPQPSHLPLLEQVKTITNSDSILLLLFHPELVDSLQGGKLPISLYEPVEETGGDQTQTRFKELAYEVETGDAERIGVDFVAKGSGTATAVTKVESASTAGASKAKDAAKSKGKGKAKDGEDGEANGIAASNVLSPEDDELISSLQAKVNAIKMLNERLNLIRKYLTSLPPSYLTDATSTAAPPEGTNHPLLRSVNAMLSRLPLLAPPTGQQIATDTQEPKTLLQQAGEREKQDVHITSLLASLTRSISEAQSMGAKFGIVQKDRHLKESRNGFGSRGGRMGGFGEESAMADNGAF